MLLQDGNTPQQVACLSRHRDIAELVGMSKHDKQRSSTEFFTGIGYYVIYMIQFMATIYIIYISCTIQYKIVATNLAGYYYTVLLLIKWLGIALIQ